MRAHAWVSAPCGKAGQLAPSTRAAPLLVGAPPLPRGSKDLVDAWPGGALWLDRYCAGLGISGQPAADAADVEPLCAALAAVSVSALSFHPSGLAPTIGPRSPRRRLVCSLLRFSTAGAQPHASPATTEPAPTPALTPAPSPATPGAGALEAGRPRFPQLRPAHVPSL